jgi:hypothetical protein
VHVDYSEEFYPKIPFYMTWPVQNMYLAELEYEKDMELMKTYYPKEAMQIQKAVEKRLDELSYEGSRIYDEEPDHEMIRREIDNIVEQIETTAAPSYFEMVPMALTEGNFKPPKPGCEGDIKRCLASVLFGTELYRRRCKNRRSKRWW